MNAPERGSTPVVVLVGPMGVGKSTVGELLAERLGTEYRDADSDIVAAAAKPIADIFVDEGEPHFREMEREAVRLAVTEHTGVLALGGGAVLDASTRELLAGLPVVFLTVEAGEALKRVGLNVARPLLAINPRRQWKQLMEERRQLYADVARVVVATDDRTPEEVVEAVLDALELKQVQGNETRTPGKETHA